MRVLITGGTGQVGRFIARGLTESGHNLFYLGRQRPFDDGAPVEPFDLLSPPATLPEADVLVHCALLHAPGRYRGGEGDDPEQFWAANAIGTERLFEAAKASGIRCVVFLSSRAVYGDAYRNRQLAEDMDAKPDTLYGRVKLAGEQALASLADHRMHGVSLRATGVYGCSPGLAGHKWSDLFRSFENGEPIASRCGTEVHGEDLASAVRLVLEKAEDLPAFSAFNVSDIMLDRHDLLARFAQGRSLRARPPQPVQGDYPAVMDCSRLRALGWSPGGFEKLASFLQNL